MSVKIIVDSASDIDTKEAKKLGIVVIPMQVIMDNEEFLSGENLSNEEFFRRLPDLKKMPQTTQINTYKFEEVISNCLKEDNDEAVVITLSSKFSGTYQNALEASKRFGDRVFVVDSLNVSIGERLLCFLAIKLVKEGYKAKEIYEILTKDRGKIKLFALLDTLKYLKKGGRISTLIALAGDIFSIKALVTVIGGEAKIIARAIGQKMGFNLLNKCLKSSKIDYEKPYGLITSGQDDTTLIKYLENNKEAKEIFKDKDKITLGPVVGAHIGPNGVGFAFFEKQ